MNAISGVNGKRGRKPGRNSNKNGENKGDMKAKLGKLRFRFHSLLYELLIHMVEKWFCKTTNVISINLCHCLAIHQLAIATVAESRLLLYEPISLSSPRVKACSTTIAA